MEVAGREGKDQHQGIAQTKRTHILITGEGTMTIGKVLVSDEQAAGPLLNVVKDELISAISQTIDCSLTIACFNVADLLATLF